MLIQLALTISAFIILFGYVGLMTRKYGIMPSFSSSYYINRKEPWFTYTLVSVAFLLMPVVQPMSLLMFFGCVLIAFCGVAAHYEAALVREVHYIGAFGGFIFLIAGMVFDLEMYILPSISVVGVLGLLLVKNRLYWIETLLCLVVFIGLMIEICR